MLTRIINLVIVVIVFLITSSKVVTGKETIRVAMHEIPPMASEHLPDGGFYARIVKEVFALNDIEFSINWYPLKRAYFLLERGEADLALGWSKVPGRELVFTFSEEPLAEALILFFYRKVSPFDWETLEDLKGLTIGDRIGSKAGGKVYLAAEKAGTIKVERVSKEELNVKKLLIGRIDVMIGDSISMPAILKYQFSQEERVRIVAHPLPLRIIQGYAIFNKQVSPRIIEAFDKGMRQLREKGKYKQLLDNALLPENKKSTQTEPVK